jgi:sugar phosphate isomerase/epimerase
LLNFKDTYFSYNLYNFITESCLLWQLKLENSYKLYEKFNKLHSEQLPNIKQNYKERVGDNMNQVKYASPLYIVREECEKDLFAVLEKLKDMGFDGIEFLGFFGKTPAELKQKLDELNLIALGNHVDYYEFLKDVNGTIKTHKEIGCKYITITGLPKTMEIDEAILSDYIKNVTEIGTACKNHGITLLYHNHDHEFGILVNGKNLLENILDKIPMENLSFEPDLGWIAIGGGEVTYYLDKYKDRCPVIHLKDYYALDTKEVGNVHELGANKGDDRHSYFEFRPVGYGIVNFPSLKSELIACNPEWMVADHDLAYSRDSYFDLKISLEYMKNLNLM